MMKTLLFGANGQVGRELIAAARGNNFDLIAPDREEVELTIEGACADAIQRCQPDCVINAAAYTAVDRAEEEQDLAMRINAGAAAEMAGAANDAGARFIHISTDYVFDGDSETPIAEDARADPLNVYGASKRDGEIAVMGAHADAAIIRTSWVYSIHGGNFVKTMLRLGSQRGELSIVDDQIGGPTPAAAIADAVLTIAKKLGPGAGLGGVYQFQGAPAASWAAFAEAIFTAANLKTKINRIKTKDYPTPAARPLRTVLDCAKIMATFGIERPDWRRDLGNIVNTLLAERQREQGTMQ